MQESLQAALAFQRQLRFDPQLDVGHPQRVLAEFDLDADAAFGIRERALQPRHADNGSTPSKVRRAATMRQASSCSGSLACCLVRANRRT